MVELTFLGGAGTVTGSRTLVTWSGGRVLIDCGSFQGLKQLRLLNWKPVLEDAAGLDAVLLTHAHIDHSGHLPVLVRDGFRGPIHATGGTNGLVRILLPDSAYLHEAAAERANRRGYSKHKPALPIYTTKDAQAAMKLLVDHEHGEALELPGGARATFLHAGHIVGASMILFEADGKRLLFSGDLGRPHDPIHPSPAPLPAADALVLESTYGGRSHTRVDPEVELGEVVRRTIARGGHVMIPAFAVGRTQRILFHLLRLQEQDQIPRVPIFLNSPLASKATKVFRLWHAEGTLSEGLCERICRLPTIVKTREDSIALNMRKEPCIMIAGSGMATGGRIVHHIQSFAPDPRHTLLFAGFLAAGTRGQRIVSGEPKIKIFGEYVPIRCEVQVLDNLSAHADQPDLLAWLGAGERPGRVVLNHGEPRAQDKLRIAIEEQLGVDVEVPFRGDKIRI